VRTLVILGPTASGKTQLAIELAKRLNGEIISADSMQVYRGMDIGTAKPTLAERQEIPHHLIDIKNPDEEWTAADFVEQVNKLAPEIIARDRQPIVVGGTGLYLWSLLEGYSFAPQPDSQEIRKRLNNNPTPVLYALLSTIDPIAASKINLNDKKRIVRALEVYELTGKRMSEVQNKMEPETKRLGSISNEEPRSSFAGSEKILIGLTLPRDDLYVRINQRVDKMISRGLINEVKALLARGYAKNLNAFQALGYKEVIDCLDGKMDKERLIGELKKRTRNFAKRQMTWFKRFQDVKWFEVPFDTMAVLDYIKSV
jgi:tRNA dimethylallyltransferase